MRLFRHAALLIALLLVAPAFAALSPAAPVQHALTTLVTPHAAELSSVGINRIVARTGEQRRDIQVMTANGPVYFAWPAGVTPVEFVIDFGEGGAPTVRAEDYADADKARYTAAMDAILREAARQVRSNNAWATRPRP
jgi:hypothetical protein